MNNKCERRFTSKKTINVDMMEIPSYTCAFQYNRKNPPPTLDFRFKQKLRNTNLTPCEKSGRGLGGYMIDMCITSAYDFFSQEKNKRSRWVAVAGIWYS